MINLPKRLILLEKSQIIARNLKDSRNSDENNNQELKFTLPRARTNFRPHTPNHQTQPWNPPKFQNRPRSVYHSTIQKYSQLFAYFLWLNFHFLCSYICNMMHLADMPGTETRLLRHLYTETKIPPPTHSFHYCCSPKFNVNWKAFVRGNI